MKPRRDVDAMGLVFIAGTPSASALNRNVRSIWWQILLPLCLLTCLQICSTFEHYAASVLRALVGPSKGTGSVVKSLIVHKGEVLAFVYNFTLFKVRQNNDL